MTENKTAEVSGWWSANPQTYGDIDGKPLYSGDMGSLGSDRFFRDADEQLLKWNASLHAATPFDRLYPYERFRGKRVLEIGCGMGAMASMWAKHGAIVTAVDLAPFSVEMTKRRFALFGLSGDIRLADGRELPFDDGAFDYVYSWGVLHHSPQLIQSLREMMRVVEVGGEFGLMLYHRRSLYYLWRVLYHEGVVHNERDFLDPVALASRYTDGADTEGNPHTWPVTKAEVRAAIGPLAARIDYRVLGMEVNEMLGYMLPGLGRLPVWMLKPWARRLGWSLWASGIRG